MMRTWICTAPCILWLPIYHTCPILCKINCPVSCSINNIEKHQSALYASEYYRSPQYANYITLHVGSVIKQIRRCKLVLVRPNVRKHYAIWYSRLAKAHSNNATLLLIVLITPSPRIYQSRRTSESNRTLYNRHVIYSVERSLMENICTRYYYRPISKQNSPAWCR